MKKLIAVLIVIVTVFSGCSLHKKTEAEIENTSSFFAMDTYMNFTVYGENSEKYLTQAEGIINDLENHLSVTDENSEIYKINHSGGQPVRVSEDTADIISYALDIADKTNGALEPTIYPVLNLWGFTTDENKVPPKEEINVLLSNVNYKNVIVNGKEIQIPEKYQLDLGSVAKGYAGDLISNQLKENGVTSALLDIGGNIQLIGAKPDGSNWKVGLTDPFSGGTLGVISTSEKAIVTSGNYERYFVDEDGKKYGHIIDPKTGYPVDNGLMSVTILGDDGKLCDALSTSLFVMGLDKAIDFKKENKDNNFDMIIITADNEIYITENANECFSLDEEHSDMQINII